MRVRKDQITISTQPREVWTQVDALGGEVLVRGLMLSEAFAVSLAAKNDNAQLVASTLARAVLCESDDGLVPVMTAEEWDAWGGANLPEAMRLFNLSQTFSGGDIEDAAKKSETSPG